MEERWRGYHIFPIVWSCIRTQTDIANIEHTLWRAMTRTKMYVKHCSYKYPYFDTKKKTKQTNKYSTPSLPASFSAVT